MVRAKMVHVVNGILHRRRLRRRPRIAQIVPGLASNCDLG
jgi:hypothetical protein